jgi:phage gpG-like protein
MTAIKVETNTGPVLKQLAQVAGKLGNLAPVHRQIGELLEDSTKVRFAQSKAPNGASWAALSETTLGRYIGTFGKSYRLKAGKTHKHAYEHTLNAGGARKLAGRKPLVASGTLAEQIFYAVSANGNELSVGSPMPYAAVQNFGQKKGASGTTKRGAPIPWGDIPAREFIGLSADDKAMMAREYADYIQGAFSAP